ncbi:MAG: metallophosphoesterase [Chthoniobacterales bacterium]|nr:metallophosphoesterase [Chthoniobacterales bacterium]
MDDFAQRNIFKYILEEVDKRKQTVGSPDFVFISGDLANKGRRDQFALFNDDFIGPLVTLLGDDYLERVFIVPGNHDVDREHGRAIRRYDVLEEVPNFLDPTAEGLMERAGLLARFKDFDEHPWTLENTRWVTSENGYLAKRFAVSGMDVGVLCINTAWFCGAKGEQRRLSPGRGMVEAGIEALAGCKPLFVVGHHPFEWLVSADHTLMRSLLGKQGAIYLCGHLHKPEQTSISSGSTPMITLQTGCAFETRADDKWATRLIWGAFDADTKMVLAQPKKWNPDLHEWTLDGDAISEDLRVSGSDYWAIPTMFAQRPNARGITSARGTKEREVTPPEGWVLLDEQFLKERASEQPDERILQYFDGSVPTWDDIFSDRIPERTIVADLVTTISEGFETGPQLTLMLGPGGEGKSTAFYQVLRTLVAKGACKIIWRSNPERRLFPEFVKSLPATNTTWLFASDEADTFVRDTYDVLRALPPKHNIHFFLTCRDTDWIESDGDGYVWAQLTSFVERNIKGLTRNDADKIIAAWSRYGARGLGKLSGLESDEAAQKLFDAATLEAGSPDGAFLGAMLRVRIGMALRDHVAALLGRLESRELQGIPGKTLLDAFAYIAVPHAFNLLFLSKSVLAKALGLDETRVRRRILGPLGEEAAAAAFGESILTRHRAIAEAAADIMSTRFHFDAEDVLVELVRAAISAGIEGALVPHLVDWRYLSTRLFEQGNQALGVKIAAAALEADPGNSFLAVKLSQLYREAGQAEQSANVFRNSIQRAQGNRAFFTEWGTCEGAIGNAAASVWLKALSLADGTEMKPPDVKDSYLGLAGSAISFMTLFERFQNESFMFAAGAAAQLGLGMSGLPTETVAIFRREWRRAEAAGAVHETPVTALKNFYFGIQKAHAQLEVEIGRGIPGPDALSYIGLERLLKISLSAYADEPELPLRREG